MFNVHTQGHSERIISDPCRVRKSLKSILREERTGNMRVLDVMGSITGKKYKKYLGEHLEDLSHGPVVHTQGHSERMISDHYRVRNSLKSISERKG
jgi:hypothetical protein